MMLLAMAMVALVVAYTACTRPNWFWAAFLCAPTVLGVIAPTENFDPNGIAVGPLFLRLSDPGTLGLLIGILYYFRPQSLRSLRNQPGARILCVILSCLALKVLLTLAAGSAISSNPIANQYLGGTVAAIGELRDAFLPLLAAFYAVVSVRHLTLSRMRAPVVVTIGVILAKAAIEIATSGKIWSDNAEFRFINSAEAIILLFLSFLLPFLHNRRSGRVSLWLLAGLAFTVAITANHRSVWLCAMVALTIFLSLVACGKLHVSQTASLRAMSTVGVALALVLGLSVLLIALSGQAVFSDSLGLQHRLLAITDPGSDSTASWRLTLWKDRVDQVADDWLWGRNLGDRRQSLVGGVWIAAPNHSGYITTFELGGLLLLGLVLMFWVSLAAGALKAIRVTALPRDAWPPALALIVIAISLVYAISYDFTVFGPALATMLVRRGSGQTTSLRSGAWTAGGNVASRWSPQPACGLRPASTRASGTFAARRQYS